MHLHNDAGSGILFNVTYLLEQLHCKLHYKHNVLPSSVIRRHMVVGTNRYNVEGL